MKKSWIIGFLLLQTFCFAQNLDSGLVGYWPFNGNAKDESGNGNDGIVHGATLCEDRYGNLNSSYYFNGLDNYIEIPNSIYSGDNIDNLTISVWINFGDINSIQKLIIYFGSITGEIDFELSNSNITLAAKLNNQIWYNISDIVPNNKWTNIIGKFKKGISLDFINGCKINSYIIPNIQLNTTFPTRTKSSIGSYNCNQRSFFNGKIDELRIYNRELSNEEILLLKEIHPSSQIYIYNYVTKVGTENFHIPIKAILNCKQMLANNLSFTAIIRFKASTFFPDLEKPFTRGERAKPDSIDKNGFRNMFIHCDSVNISDKDSILTELVGTVLLGDSVTPIEISDFQWNNWSIEIDTIINGSLTTKACAMHLRKVQLFNPPTLTIQPNPSNEELTVSFEGDEKGLYSLNLSNTQGVKLESIEWYNQKNGKQDFRIDLKTYSDGFYYLVLKTPTNIISKPVIISR